MIRASSLSLLLVLSIGLTGTAPAQPNLPRYGEGTHYFRAVINAFKLRPITQREFDIGLKQNPGSILLVVLGKADVLDRFAPNQLGDFIRNGGAFLLASDQNTHGNVEGDLNIQIAGDHLVVPAGSVSAYRDLVECPLVRNFGEVPHPIFRGVGAVATNVPGHLIRGRREFPPLPVLAWFPGDARWESEDAPPARPRIFTAGRELGAGKLLVLSDHSVFINDMLPQPDNDNLTFAYNCINWLTDHGKRNQVFFLEDGRVVTNFNITLKEPPPPVLPPLPPEEQLIDKGNEILAGLDDGDVFNRLINERVRPDTILRAALLIATGLLCLGGLWRLSNNRHRIDRNDPVLATCLADQGTRRTLVDWRNESLLRQNNCWEVAHQQARQCFASLLECRAGSRTDTVEIRHSAPPNVAATGGWWHRRRMKRTVLRLWRLASGRYPEKITAAGLRRIEEELHALRTAVANGTLQLSDGARTA